MIGPQSRGSNYGAKEGSRKEATLELYSKNWQELIRQGERTGKTPEEDRCPRNSRLDHPHCFLLQGQLAELGRPRKQDYIRSLGSAKRI